MHLSESHFCTNFARPLDYLYHSCTGLKDKAIMERGADSNNSWLRYFNSYEEFWRVSLTSFRDFYWNEGRKTPFEISCKWVSKKCSYSWANTVANALKQL